MKTNQKTKNDTIKNGTDAKNKIKNGTKIKQ